MKTKNRHKITGEADLRGADLSGVDFSGADFSKADFSGVYLSGSCLSGVDFSGATGPKKLPSTGCQIPRKQNNK